MESSSDSNVSCLYKIDLSKFTNEELRTKNVRLNDNDYTIVNINESVSVMDSSGSHPLAGLAKQLKDELTGKKDDLRQYRSVVLDENKNVLCISPSKSVEMDEMRDCYNVWVESSYSHSFSQKYDADDEGSGDGTTLPAHSDKSCDFWVNEIIEGTMINLFYDTRINKWEIATRSSVGGNYWFYRTQYNNILPSQKTFRKMFLECFGEMNDLDEVPFINELDKNMCYSFVIQHPENHIVLPIMQPAIYLVSVYKLCGGNVVGFVPQSIYEKWSIFNRNRMILLPATKPLEDSFDAYIQKYANIQCGYQYVGVMITQLSTGDRFALSNPVYEELKELRGNNPNLQYQYFSLLKSRQISRFLQFFPHYKKLFGEFWDQYNRFITNVHQSYYSYYIKKENIPISKKYFVHVSKIHHNIFIPSLNESIQGTGTKKIITRYVVKEYFDAMSPSEILYYMNYENRKIAENTISNVSVEL